MTSPYDAVPYPHRSFAACHPDRLGVVARLHGLDPAAIETCRVLEIGCGTGGNLLPIASHLPRATLVGIDPSRAQIDIAAAMAREAGLSNVELIASGIEARGDTRVEAGVEARGYPVGPFDYILCHGVFSWVSVEVQQAILAAIGRLLAPQGVAYVSHTTLPGWHQRRVIRELATFHERVLHETSENGRLSGSQRRAQQVRDIVGRVRRAVPVEMGAFGAWVDAESARLAVVDDAYIVHEHLSQESHPVYLHELVDRAGAFGLLYLGDALPHLVSPANASPELLALIEDRSSESSDADLTAPSPSSQRALQGAIQEAVVAQQYMDFAQNTAFRQSLFVRRDALARGERGGPEAVSRLYVRSSILPAETVDLTSSRPESFVSERGGLTLDRPIVKAAFLTLLRAAPAALSFDELLLRSKAAVQAAGGSSDGAREALESELFALFHETDLVELHMYDASPVAAASARPRVCAHTRGQARGGGALTNAWHHEILLADRAVLSLVDALDGSRDRSQLVALVRGWIRDGSLSEAEISPPLAPDSGPGIPLDSRGMVSGQGSVLEASQVDGVDEFVGRAIAMLDWLGLLVSPAL